MLEAFVGQWDVAGKISRSGAADNLSFTGSNEAAWDGGGMYLVRRGVSRIGQRSEVYGMAAWTYDRRSALFRSVLINSTGTISTATAYHDPETETWHMRATANGPEGKTWWRGRIRFLDPVTKEEHWAGYTFGGLIKTVDIKKTELRRR